MLRSRETILYHLLFDPSKFSRRFVGSRNWKPQEFDVPKCEGSVSDVYRLHDNYIVKSRSRIPTDSSVEFLARKKPNLFRITFGRCVFYCASNGTIFTCIWKVNALWELKKHCSYDYLLITRVNFAMFHSSSKACTIQFCTYKSRHVIKMNCDIYKLIFSVQQSNEFHKIIIFHWL